MHVLHVLHVLCVPTPEYMILCTLLLLMLLACIVLSLLYNKLYDEHDISAFGSEWYTWQLNKYA